MSKIIIKLFFVGFLFFPHFSFAEEENDNNIKLDIEIEDILKEFQEEEKKIGNILDFKCKDFDYSIFSTSSFYNLLNDFFSNFIGNSCFFRDTDKIRQLILLMEKKVDNYHYICKKNNTGKTISQQTFKGIEIIEKLKSIKLKLILNSQNNNNWFKIDGHYIPELYGELGKRCKSSAISKIKKAWEDAKKEGESTKKGFKDFLNFDVFFNEVERKAKKEAKDYMTDFLEKSTLNIFGKSIAFTFVDTIGCVDVGKGGEMFKECFNSRSKLIKDEKINKNDTKQDLKPKSIKIDTFLEKVQLENTQNGIYLFNTKTFDKDLKMLKGQEAGSTILSTDFLNLKNSIDEASGVDYEKKENKNIGLNGIKRNLNDFFDKHNTKHEVEKKNNN